MTLATDTTPSMDMADTTTPQETPPTTAATAPLRPPQGRPRTISHPQDVFQLVLRQISTVSATKDDLTIAIKGLTDLTRQLAQAYAGQAQAIQRLQSQVQELEARARQ